LNGSGRAFDVWADAVPGRGAASASPLWRRALAAVAGAIGSLVLWFVWSVFVGLLMLVALSMAASSASAVPVIAIVVTSAHGLALALLPRLLGWWPVLSRWSWRWGVVGGAVLAIVLVLGLAAPSLVPDFLRILVATDGLDLAAKGVALAVFLAVLFVSRPARDPRVEQALPADSPSVS
jgi:hypothetical protein